MLKSMMWIDQMQEQLKPKRSLSDKRIKNSSEDKSKMVLKEEMTRELKN